MDDFELQEILNRRRRFEQLAGSQSPQGRMVGNVYVNANPLEYLAQGLRARAGQKGLESTEREMQGVQQKRQTMDTEAMGAFSRLMQDQPARQIQPFTPNDDEGNPNVPAQMDAQRANPMGAFEALMGAYNPQMRQAGMQGMIRIPEIEAERQFRTEQRTDDMNFKREQLQAQQVAKQEAAALAHQQRMEQLAATNASREQMAREQQEFRAQMASDARAHQQSMAQLSASLRPEKNVTVLGPNGEAITLPQSQAQGLPLYNPQAASSLQKDKTKKQAKEQLSSVVQQLNTSYDALEKGGGITSTQGGMVGNLMARSAASGVGQALGGALGTENQRQRQEIAQTRPLLMNLIKEATGMSAQQMNSNAEMQLYLQAATDPTLTVEANRSALANLDRLFGLGLAVRPDAPKPSPVSANPGNPRLSTTQSSQDAQALQWARSNPNDPRAAQIMQRLGAK
jgi:hypothetical protein